MDTYKKIVQIRKKLSSGKVSIGTWMQTSNADIAEIIGSQNYDWITLDLEHGSIDISHLPDLFRAIEIGNTLPLVRVNNHDTSVCNKILDAGAGGLIIPNIRDADQLNKIRLECSWPPVGKRGVGFSRANLYGKNFNKYKKQAQSPFLVAMIDLSFESFTR